LFIAINPAKKAIGNVGSWFVDVDFGSGLAFATKSNKKQKQHKETWGHAGKNKWLKQHTITGLATIMRNSALFNENMGGALKKFVGVCCFLMWFCVSVFGQQTRFMEFGENNRRNPNIYVLGADREGFYVFRYGNRDRYIEKFGYDFRQLSSTNLALLPAIHDVIDVSVVMGKPAVFMQTENGPQNALSVVQLSDDGKLTQAHNVLIDSLEARRNAEGYQVLISRNKTHAAVLHRSNQALGSLAFAITWLQSDSLAATAPSHFRTSGEQKVNWIMRNADIDDEGRVVALCRRDDLRIKEGDPRRSSFSLLIAKPGAAIEFVDVPQTNSFIADMLVVPNNTSRTWLVAGLVSAHAPGQTGQVLYGNYDPETGKWDTITVSGLSSELLSRMVGARNVAKNMEPTDLILRNIYPTTAGGFTAVAEMRYMTTRTITQNINGFASYRNVTYYHYDDMLAFNVGENGKLGWNSLIGKDQTTTSPEEFSSFACITLPEQMVLLFNESPYLRSNLLQTKADVKGKVNTTVVLGPEVGDLLIMPEGLRQVSMRTALVPCYKGKRYGILKISY